ncbi:MAG: alpha-glucosidase C-terminal domain-containing protein [Melioribacteraceae bacterium]|nr:alpha-glucosidase C-terminal domain-containing protein [Melioribacteraceae bacterium]MCF8356767.1 alpha-glucosidase C-terminal domain-containing protein [Melioribacteraceae bacterium]MCF8396129.1 alpha-glucosidase C-terminal domain-containing protein [Melioribacteraceae bacterium]MCF8421105.1 alpha-glucosidase C-terminal domain-containing protein [Melioribacteraceae bacterium]
MKKFFAVILMMMLFISCQTKTGQPVEITNLSHPGWSKNSSIYEVNIRQFTEEGTFNAFAERLPELKEMGINILWIMPIHPIGELNRKGSLGSYYAVKDYKAVNPEFGTLEDFKNLVDKVHALEMKIIIDWVANHTAWDHPWTETNPGFYTKDSTGNFIPPVADWSDVIDLNYDNEELRKEMHDALLFWVKNYNIDGYRCDVAEMVPIEFWNNVRAELDKIKPVFMLAEGSVPELHENAFDMTYNWDVHHIMNKIYSGENSLNELYDELKEDAEEYTRNPYRMQFTSNHDENSWNGSAIERLGESAELFTVFSVMIEGMPLVYNGQEAGNENRLDFFEKDPIEWKESNFRLLYTTILNEKKRNKALWNGTFGGAMEYLNHDNKDNVFAFTREKDGDKVIAFFNMSKEKQTVNVTDELIKGSYTELFSGEKTSFSDSENFEISPWKYTIFVKR